MSLRVVIFMFLVRDGILLEQNEKVLKKRPTIGILAQELPHSITYPGGQFNSYIAASYVKAVEASGARVVPVMYVLKFL